jgi:hypothetical protein
MPSLRNFRIQSSPTPLPARVRLMDVLTAPNTTSQGETDESATQVLVTPTQLALAQVDHSTHASALRLFYAENTFLFREHPANHAPLRNWIDTVTRERGAYGDAVKLIRRVILEKRISKTCGAGSPAQRYSRDRREQHIYRIAITAQPDGALSVDFGADLAGVCACTTRTAALVPAFSTRKQVLSVDGAARGYQRGVGVRSGRRRGPAARRAVHVAVLRYRDFEGLPGVWVASMVRGYGGTSGGDGGEGGRERQRERGRELGGKLSMRGARR